MRSWRLYLEDIAESCAKVESYVKGMSRQQFFDDGRTYDAVVRNLMIVGEATRNIPSSVREQMPVIPWHEISGMRNILAHEYFGMDNKIVWDVVQVHLPVLHSEVTNFLNALDS